MKKKVILFFLTMILLSLFTVSSFALDLAYYDPLDVSDLSVIYEMRKAALSGDEEAYSRIYDSLESDPRVVGYDPDKYVPYGITLAKSAFRRLDEEIFIIPEGMSAANDAVYKINFNFPYPICEFTLSGWEITTYCDRGAPESELVLNSFPVVATLKTNRNIDLEVRYRSENWGEYYFAYLYLQGDSVYIQMKPTKETTSDQPPFEELGTVNFVSLVELMDAESNKWNLLHVVLPVCGAAVVIGGAVAVALIVRKKRRKAVDVEN